MRYIRHLLVVCGALAAFLLSWHVSEAVFHRAPITTDEHSYALQAHLFSTGRIKYPPPPFIGSFSYKMVIVDRNAGWLSRYPPGHGIWLMFGAWMDNLYFMVALAAALGLLLTVWVARRIGASVAGVILLLLLSPYYVFTYGTMLSHTSGFVMAAGMLLAYIQWQQGEQPVWALIAGLAWAWLFLNRTYTALLMAVPFALDALWYLWRQRTPRACCGTLLFAGAACLGIAAIMVYNWAAVGHPLRMTYLFYNPSEKLGFGLRRNWPIFPATIPVTHTPIRGLSDLKDNILLLDQWMLGFRGGLLLWLAMTVIGWSKRWSPLLVGSAVMVPLGYVLFYYGGWNETGPIYYFETYPALVLSAGLGMAVLWQRLQARPVMALVLAVLIIPAWASTALPFARAQAEHFRGETAPRRAVLDTIASAPPQTIVFVSPRVVERAWPNHDFVFTPHGLEGDIIVARAFDASNRTVMRYFSDYTPLYIAYLDGEFGLHPMKDDQPIDISLPITRLHTVTGTNIRDEDNPQRMIRLAREGDPAGKMAFGYFIKTYPTRFRVEFDVSATTTNAGTLQIVVRENDFILKAKPIPVSEDWQTVVFEWDMHGFHSIEPRVLYHGEGEVRLSQVRIAGLDAYRK